MQQPSCQNALPPPQGRAVPIEKERNMFCPTTLGTLTADGGPQQHCTPYAPPPPCGSTALSQWIGRRDKFTFTLERERTPPWRKRGLVRGNKGKTGIPCIDTAVARRWRSKVAW